MCRKSYIISSNLQNVHFDLLDWIRLHNEDSSGPVDLLLNVSIKLRWS